jgi:2-isopropylmalate synthase
MWRIFRREYLEPGRLAVAGYSTATVDGKVEITAEIMLDGVTHRVDGIGNGPIDAFTHALSTVDVTVRVLDYNEHALSSGGDATAAAYVECDVAGEARWGVGVDPNILTASLQAVASAVNRG